MSCEYLAECRQAYRESEAHVDRLFVELSREQLEWKPGENRWSVVQCIDHLARVRQVHLKRLVKAVEHGRTSGIVGGEPPYGLGTALGRWLLGSFGQPKRFKTTKRFQAAKNPVAEDIHESFRTHNKTLIEVARDSDGLDLGRIKVGAPPTPLVRLSLAQGFQLHVLHDKRHLTQAEEVLSQPGFPAA